MVLLVSRLVHFLSLVRIEVHAVTRLSYFIPTHVSVRAHCFPIRVIVLWNRLPASVVLAENIQMFTNY